jgi:aryl-alcohol dehydrogenase-like predicted oxidoreductase
VTSARWIPSVRRPSKVGKLFKASKDNRLGVDSLDVAFVHDISPDFAYFPNGWEEQYELARKGAFPALSKMRDEGIIRAWGIGVNKPQPILKVMDDADPDVCLCARQYSLIDHADAVRELFPVARKKNVRSSSGPRSMQASYPGAPTITGRKTSRSPRPRLKSAKNSARWPLVMAWIFARPRFNSRQRRMSRLPSSSGREAISRSPKTIIRCRRKSRPNSGPSLSSKL